MSFGEHMDEQNYHPCDLLQYGANETVGARMTWDD